MKRPDFGGDAVAIRCYHSAAGLEHTDVYVSGQDGYSAYRIPAIETAPDGSLLAFAEARKHNLGDPGFARQDIDLVLKRSTNAGRAWSKAEAGEQVTPVCCALERLTSKAAGDDRDRILWTGPKGPQRSNLVARVSCDEGRTFPRERLIAAGPAAYSDLTVLRDKTVGVLWGRGVKRGYEFITYTRFDSGWLEAGEQTP